METSIQQPVATGNRISTLLRWSGAILLLVAALHYMLQGLDLTSEALRFWVMPSFIVFVALCGLCCGYWFGDSKSARVFFGLGTAFVAAQLSQVAAMGRGLLIRGQAGEVPLDMWWDLEQLSPLVFGMNVLVSLVLIVPVAYAAFSILARQQRNHLISDFILANAVMLLPVRDPLWMTVLILGLFAVLRCRDALMYRSERVMSSMSGIAARLLVWLPLFIMVGRSLFYPVSELQAALLLTVFAWMLIEDTPRIFNKSMLTPILQLLGLALAIAGWCVAAEDTIQVFSNHTEVYCRMLPSIGLMLMVSTRIQAGGSGLRLFTAWLAMLTAIVMMLDSQLYSSALVTIITGLVLSAMGLHYREKIVFACGLISVSAGVLFYASYLFEKFDSMPWFIAALLGVAALLLASWIEKQQGQWMGRATHGWKTFRAWSA